MNFQPPTLVRRMSNILILCLVPLTRTSTLNADDQSLVNLENRYLEDVYIAHFGNNPPEVLQQWYPLRNVWLTEQVDKLRELVRTAHIWAGKGLLDLEHLQVGMHVRNLIFNNTQYRPRMMEMVHFCEFYKHKIPVFYRIIEGLRPGCVIYVVGDEFIRDFRLDQHVCGIETALFEANAVGVSEEENWRSYVYPAV